jgi:hypothetical protein
MRILIGVLIGAALTYFIMYMIGKSLKAGYEAGQNTPAPNQ